MVFQKDLFPDADNCIFEQSESVYLAHISESYANKANKDLLESTFRDVASSWIGCLNLIPIHRIDKHSKYLRQAQVSALFSILGHLSNVEPTPATIVMPTGTGKTETMIAAVCALAYERVLVVVPSDSLREQTFKKFVALGLLRKLNVIRDQALNPVTAMLKGGVKTTEDFDLVNKANVVITTPQSLALSEKALRNKFYKSCDLLILDEAHHVRAPTWQAIKKSFENKGVLQFTATPFREDRQKVDGKIIFNYPISEAQKVNLFRHINFDSVYEVVQAKADFRIAEKAVNKLAQDLQDGKDHILMARCYPSARAEKVYEIYKENYPEYSPVLIHSGVKKRKSKLQDINAKKHRIIVCVNMLGEGFDLPELKVCAFHDIHKTLAITLQFAGRFVRDRDDLGDPTFIANICDTGVEDTLRDLYMEDSEWSRVLRLSSETLIENQVAMQEFVANNEVYGKPMAIENLFPPQSAVVYRVDKNVKLEPFLKGLEPYEEVESYLYDDEKKLIISIIKSQHPYKWARQNEFPQIERHLMMIFWDQEQSLLCLHDSAKIGARYKVVKKISRNATLIKGDSVFKVFGNVMRLSLQNAGLNRGRSGALRYVMYTGIDIAEAIDQIRQRISYKSNIFGKGFEGGAKVTVGCSHKGRIWSMRSSDVLEWINWCTSIGGKLLDRDINPDDVLNGTMRTNEITQFPDKLPIGIDWPSEFYERGLASDVVFDGVTTRLDEIEIRVLSEKCTKNEIVFALSHDEKIIQMNAEFVNKRIQITSDQKDLMRVLRRGNFIRMADYFANEHYPLIYLEDGSLLEGDIHIVRAPNQTSIPFDTGSLVPWVWDVNITNESQGVDKNQDSIQYAVLEKLKEEEYLVLFDDDGANEVADIVAFKEEGSVFVTELYHLKFSSSDTTGSRVKDFYEVCGQAIRSTRWIDELDKLILRLKNRERSRLNSDPKGRIEKGDYKLLDSLAQHGGRMKKEYRIFIVQPGLSASKITENVINLLGGANEIIVETTSNKLSVICSE